MRKILSYVLYTALMVGANTATADFAELEALRAGDMKKLVLHSSPKELPVLVFTDADGSESQLSDYAGKYILLNFWATWCAPCRAEMPALDRLNRDLGGEKFEVVTIATGRNPVPAMKKFFAQIGVETLPLHRDPKQLMARRMAVLGLPVSIFLDPEGREIGRLIGDADWAGEQAHAFVSALIQDDGES